VDIREGEWIALSVSCSLLLSLSLSLAPSSPFNLPRYQNTRTTTHHGSARNHKGGSWRTHSGVIFFYMREERKAGHTTRMKSASHSGSLLLLESMVWRKRDGHQARPPQRTQLAPNRHMYKQSTRKTRGFKYACVETKSSHNTTTVPPTGTRHNMRDIKSEREPLCVVFRFVVVLCRGRVCAQATF